MAPVQSLIPAIGSMIGTAVFQFLTILGARSVFLQLGTSQLCNASCAVNIGTVESIKSLVKDLNDSPVPSDVEVVIAPAFIHLYQVLQSIKPEIGVAAQNCWSTHMGAYTGEVRTLHTCLTYWPLQDFYHIQAAGAGRSRRVVRPGSKVGHTWPQRAATDYWREQ